MPCSDSSSSMVIRLDHDEKILDFEYAKITCGREITAKSGFVQYLVGKELKEILDIDFKTIVRDLNLKEEEAQFILYLEWDALRSAVALYLGIEDENIDTARCHISSIEHTEKGIEIALIILPPKEMPKILPCNLADN